MILTTEQQSAIAFVERYANNSKEECLGQIDLILSHSHVDRNIFELVLSEIMRNATIGLHFHPDRFSRDSTTVCQGLLQSGEYKNQFETEVSSGSLTAFGGGSRDIWEQSLFGGWYHSPKVALPDRPKYGSLNLTLTEDGPSPRFGSCYFMLNPSVKQRSTFTYGDSHRCPKEIGTSKSFHMVMNELLNDVFTRNQALGAKNTNVEEFFTFILSNISQSLNFERYKSFSRNLDFYIETQVHGKISLERDVDSLIADYSFKGTAVEIDFMNICAKYNINFLWHSGFQMKVSEFPLSFRGPLMPEIAKRVSKNGIVNAYLLGIAAQKVEQESDLWNDLGTKHELAQLIKYLWHCLVKFGEPINKKASH